MYCFFFSIWDGLTCEFLPQYVFTFLFMSLRVRFSEFVLKCFYAVGSFGDWKNIHPVKVDEK